MTERLHAAAYAVIITKIVIDEVVIWRWRSMSQPFASVCVLDFSTLPPGPLATLLLPEAGGRDHQDRASRRFGQQPAPTGRAISALPTPLDPAFRGKAAILGCPALGEHNDLMNSEVQRE